MDLPDSLLLCSFIVEKDGFLALYNGVRESGRISVQLLMFYCTQLDIKARHKYLSLISEQKSRK